MQKIDIRWFFLLRVAMVISPAFPVFAGSNPSCQSIPPVMTLELSAIYESAKTSIPLKDAEEKNGDVTAPITALLNSAEKPLDSGAHPGDPTADCAFENFRKWAHAGALTVEPEKYNTEGMFKRTEFLNGMEIVALKFRAAGYPRDNDIDTWLRTMSQKITHAWMTASNRGNMRIWAAASAALHAVIEHDPTALAFQDQVWHEAISAIHDNGTIDAELGRGHRALVYHMYSFSATLVLRAARAALGYTETPQDHVRLKLLSDSIGHWLCTPHDLEVLANSPQEIPGDWAYPVIDGFGTDLLDNDWSHCGRGNNRVNTAPSGGDARMSAELLAHIAQRLK